MALPPIEQRRNYGCTGAEYVAIAVREYGWSGPDVHDANDNEGCTYTAIGQDGFLGLLVQTDVNDQAVCVCVSNDNDLVYIVEPDEGIPTPAEAYMALADRGGMDLDVVPWWYDVQG